MFCDEVLDAIEPIAAGDLTPDGRIADHLATCPNCAAALESARALERMLQQRQTLKAPAQFTTRTVVNLFGTGLVTFAQRVGPSIPLYAGATALLATALGIWWWAERDATL